jgi:hypothetical protein
VSAFYFLGLVLYISEVAYRCVCVCVCVACYNSFFSNNFMKKLEITGENGEPIANPSVCS